MFQIRQQLTDFVKKVSHQSVLLLSMALGECGTNKARKVEILLVDEAGKKGMEEKSTAQS